MGLPAFRPSRHGFPFANEFEYPGHLVGRGAAVSAPFGLSAGFCWAALDRYLAERRVPRTLPAPFAGEPLYLELLQRQTNAIMQMGWARALHWQRLPDDARGGTAGLAELSRVEWRWVRRSLDAEMPVLLYLVSASSAFDSPFENQFVLAYRYELDRGANRLTIWVYDPNRPDNDEVRLTLRDGPRRSSLDARLALKAEVRGFFAVSYDRAVPPQLEVEEARSRDGQGSILLLGAPSVRIRRGGRVEAVTRDRSGRLLVLECAGRGDWRREQVEVGGRSPEEPRPTAAPVIAPSGRLRAFARAAGGLVEYRRGLMGWAARSVTAPSGSAPASTIDSQPAVLNAGSSIVVFARRGGDVMQFSTRGGSWVAENLSARVTLAGGHDLVGELAAARGPDGTRHLFGRTRKGHLLHFHWRKDAGWAGECVNADLDRFGLTGDPVVVESPRERALHVLGRNAAGVPLDFCWRADSGWATRSMDEDAAGPVVSDLSAAVGPDGTVHAVARGTDGQLLHFWSHGEPTWRSQDVTGTDSALGDAFRVDGDPRLTAGPGEWLHVFARRGDDVLIYRWSPDADWSAESLQRDRDRSATVEGDPVVAVGPDGVAHAFGVAASGTLLHLRSAMAGRSPSMIGRGRGLVAAYALLDLLALPARWAARALGGGTPRRSARSAGQPVRAALAAARSVVAAVGSPDTAAPAGAPASAGTGAAAPPRAAGRADGPSHAPAAVAGAPHGNPALRVKLIGGLSPARVAERLAWLNGAAGQPPPGPWGTRVDSETATAPAGDATASAAVGDAGADSRSGPSEAYGGAPAESAIQETAAFSELQRALDRDSQSDAFAPPAFIGESGRGEPSAADVARAFVSPDSAAAAEPASHAGEAAPPVDMELARSALPTAEAVAAGGRTAEMAEATSSPEPPPDQLDSDREVADLILIRRFDDDEQAPAPVIEFTAPPSTNGHEPPEPDDPFVAAIEAVLDEVFGPRGSPDERPRAPEPAAKVQRARLLESSDEGPLREAASPVADVPPGAERISGAPRDPEAALPADEAVPEDGPERDEEPEGALAPRSLRLVKERSRYYLSEREA